MRSTRASTSRRGRGTCWPTTRPRRAPRWSGTRRCSWPTWTGRPAACTRRTPRATWCRSPSIPARGAITNKTTLSALGLGANANEAELVARWALGDPAQGNTAVLGSIVNSTPIDVGQPGADPNPGGKEFSDKYANRPQVTYVGSDDGMLHAFYTKDVTFDGVAHAGGSEAFAYIPPEMLPVITKLYAQGGQLPDPNKHIFGLASSAKVKSICTANCTDKTTRGLEDGAGDDRRLRRQQRVHARRHRSDGVARRSR